MTKHTKKRGDKTKLPCHWVDDEGFSVTPIPSPVIKPQGMSDTAFLLKAKQSASPTRFPTP